MEIPEGEGEEGQEGEGGREEKRDTQRRILALLPSAERF